MMSNFMLVVGLLLAVYLLMLHWQVWLSQQSKPPTVVVTTSEQPQSVSAAGCLFSVGILVSLIIGLIYLSA